MKRALLFAAALGLAASPAFPQEQTATATFLGADGGELGTATLTGTPHGVLIEASLAGIDPGPHGFHIHETGDCNPDDGFESAGGHYAPAGNDHGFLVEAGPHAGDMPNQVAGEDGLLEASVLNPYVSLTDGDANLFDDDGSALMVHSGADDYRSQPSGDAGDRVACAVIEAAE